MKSIFLAFFGTAQANPDILEGLRGALKNFKNDRRRLFSVDSNHTVERKKFNDEKEYDEQDCVTLLQELTNHFISKKDTIYKIYRNSGKDYNDYGRFDECEAIPDQNYMLITVDPKKGLSNPLSMGLCMPTVCKEADLNAIKPYIMPVVNQQLPYIFEGVQGLNMSHLQLFIDDIHLIDSRDHNIRATQFKYDNFLFISLMIGLVVVAIVSSVISHQKYLKRKKEIQERRQMMQEQSAKSLSIQGKKKSSSESKKRAFEPSEYQTVFERFVKAFSIQKNLRKLFSPNRYEAEDPELECLNAVKVYSICIIVLGNTFYFILTGPL